MLNIATQIIMIFFILVDFLNCYFVYHKVIAIQMIISYKVSRNVLKNR